MSQRHQLHPRLLLLRQVGLLGFSCWGGRVVGGLGGWKMVQERRCGGDGDGMQGVGLN